MYHFLIILRATWLLHPSQVEKHSCNLDDYYSSIKPTTTSAAHLPSALIMVQSRTTELKNAPSADSPVSKHKITQQQKKPSTSNKPSSKVPGINNVFFHHYFHLQTN